MGFAHTLGLGMRSIHNGSNLNYVPFASDLSTTHSSLSKQDVTTFIAYGDSITAGIGCTTPLIQRYSRLVSDTLGIIEKNAGESGATVQVELYNYRTWFGNSDWDRNSIVVLYAGINDCSYTEINGLGSRENFTAKYQEIIDYIATHGYNMSNVYLCNLAWGTEARTAYAPIYNLLINELAINNSLKTINLYQATLDKPELLSDGLHFNEAGHIVLSQKILNSL